MGYSGGFVHDGRRWYTGAEVEQVEEEPEHWLAVDVHDSDLAILRYRPVGDGSGVAYVGYTPRIYFEDDEASDPTDVPREAAALAHWAGARGAAAQALAERLGAWLAPDVDPDLEPEDPDVDLPDLTEADAFVEVRLGWVITALGLPLPADLEGWDEA